MILGIGADLANIERIEATLARFGHRFVNRVFSDEEIATANRRQQRGATFARRWAAKEACAKALGTGLRMGIGWRNIAVCNRDLGQPHLVLTGWAAKRLQAMTPPDHEAVVHLSISDDYPWAQAFVVIEARRISLDPAG
jgi:holo-[acyl-carrier protein] synthase